MSEEKRLRLTYGTFDVVGTITVIPDKTFIINEQGKNNKNFVYNRINMKMEDDNGDVFYLNAMNGFDKKKGGVIFATIKDSNEQLEVNFADRMNEKILENIDERSFIKVALTKKEDENGRKVWDYKKFLALYDVIEYLSERLETGMKLRITGQLRYSTFNDKTQIDHQINNVYLLSEEDNIKPRFVFRQNVLLKEDAVDLSEWDDNLIAKVNAEVLTKNKGQYKLLKLPMTVRATEENKEKMKKMIDRYLIVDSGKVRRINLEGRFVNGYVGGQIQEEDLPEEALEMIELGLYDKEEVLKMYVNKERVEEMQIIRPVINRKQGEKPSVDWSDEEYTLEDLENITTETPFEKTIKIEDDEEDDLSFLDELE